VRFLSLRDFFNTHGIFQQRRLVAYSIVG
jgi:hypothetical protein